MARTAGPARLVGLAGVAVTVTAAMIGLAAPALASAPTASMHGSGRGGSLPRCAAAAVRATRAGITLTALPAACRGLRPDQVTRAAVTAISELAAHGPKSERRHLAATYGARLSYLINQVRPHRRAGPPASSGASGPPGTLGPPAGSGVPAALAALVAWLLTAATGAYLLAGWLVHGGIRRGRRSRTGLPPSVILTHFGLAVAGLLGWVGYLVSGAAPIAWLAAGLLLPVVGLGMATLVLSIPEGGSGSAPAASARMPVVVISAHGILATVTMLLVLLAAIASGH